MTDVQSCADETYKFFIKRLGVRFHRRLGYDGDEIDFKNVELIPPVRDRKIMDMVYFVDDEYFQNLEHQSTPVYSPKMEDIFKYRVYFQANEDLPGRTCVIATYDINRGITDAEIPYNINFHPDFFYTKKLSASETIKTISDKNSKQIPLTDNEAIDLIIAPDMEHGCDMRDLLETTTQLLNDAVITDEQFYFDLIECQKKVLQRFLKKDERKEILKMLNLKAEDYGFEPGVTGFEEAVNISFFDGKREGIDEAKLESTRNLIRLGIADDVISEANGIDLKTINELKKELTD